ncbi:hypothetical protein IGX41_11210 [Bacillus velezensis]|nr:hypothetical protein [Bacillus velezensis]PHQ07431.1 hypothetical protein CJ031_06920 [Bacillus velezensis]QNQ52014.1 hypothetical protein IAR44_02640 [Bacillus velezensis]
MGHIESSPELILILDLDYGKGYKYAHDKEKKLTTMHTMPDSLIGREYYYPTTQG